jgi:hypothetical protein
MNEVEVDSAISVEVFGFEATSCLLGISLPLKASGGCAVAYALVPPGLSRTSIASLSRLGFVDVTFLQRWRGSTQNPALNAWIRGASYAMGFLLVQLVLRPLV